jgi:osmoprotectant transport system substrate-binding protein
MGSPAPASMPHPAPVTVRLLACASVALASIAITACGSTTTAVTPPPSQTTTTQTTTLPGIGKPPVTIGDKNYTEQFLLGELYYQALQAQGFPVLINQNIGPTQVTMQALRAGSLGMYPEYLNLWNSQIAGNPRAFSTRRAAYVAAEHYALGQGLELLDPTPFSDTYGVAVTDTYAQQNRLHTIGDLQKVQPSLTMGAPPQFSNDPTGLPALEASYAFVPTAVKALEIGNQYQALDQNAVQAAVVNTTDGWLTTGNYSLLADPRRVLGVGNVVPVVAADVLNREGPAFAATVNRVTALLTLPVIRELNAAVDLSGETPAGVAKRFLVDHGVIPPSSSVT